MRPFASLLVAAARSGAPARLFPANSVLTSHIRHFGVMDTLRAQLEKKKESKINDKKLELFTAQVKYLADSPTYTMSQHIIQLQDSAKAAGVTGWKSKLRSSAEQAELEAQFAEVKIGEALLPSELADPKEVDRRAKLRIAAQLGLDVSRVNKFLHNYDEMTNMHNWLRKRVERGLPIPTSMQEYQRMMMEDPTGTSRKQMQKNMGRIRSARAMYK